jgi:RNA polymerase sigma-54 factor
MKFSPRTAHQTGLRARVEFAQLLAAPEREVAETVRELEGEPLFRRLVDAGVVAIDAYASARFAARRFAGYELRSTGEGLPEAIDGNSDEIRLLSRLGRELFEEVFLRDEALTDRQRAERCAISEREAKRLREFVDTLYIQAEFSAAPSQGAPATVFSSVAGVSVEAGQPVLAFFHREIWKGRYRIDAGRREDVLGALTPTEARGMSDLLRQLELVDRRKTTLYQVLEAVLEAQAEYFITRDPDRRRPLTQRDLASRLEVCPSVINRVITNKAIELPWGVEVPLKDLLPSRKTVLRDQVYLLTSSRPGLTDDAIKGEIDRLFGVSLSRQSISQYRREVAA